MPVRCSCLTIDCKKGSARARTVKEEALSCEIYTLAQILDNSTIEIPNLIQDGQRGPDFYDI